MKLAIVLAVVFAVLAIAMVQAQVPAPAEAECDPDGNGQPICSSSNLNVKLRNFWDPTRYWLCTAAGAAPESIRCKSTYLFDSAQGKCISYAGWMWTPPCP